MQKIKWFLRLRKREDAIKIFVVILLTGIWMFGKTVYEGIQFYNELNRFDEYVFSCKNLSITTEQNIETIKTIKNIEGISPQTEYMLGLKKGDTSVDIQCFAVSAEYMKNVYGIEYKSGEIYMTAGAFDKVLRETGVYKNNSGNTMKSAGQTTGDYQFEYTLDKVSTDSGMKNEPENAASENGICKVKQLDSKMSSSQKEYALIVKSRSILKNDSTNIRVCIKKHDVDGMTIKEIESYNFVLKKDENYTSYETKQKIKFLKIKYKLIIGVLCMVFSRILWKVTIRSLSEK